MTEALKKNDWVKNWGIEAAFILIIALLVFRAVLPVGTYLMTTDDNIGDMAARKAQFPAGFLGGWRDSVLVGEPQVLELNWTNLLLWLLPLEFFVDWLHAIDLGLASIFLMLFLRKRGLGLTSRLVGALVAFWLGTNMTLTFAGHIGKYGVLLFASAYLWLVEEAISRKSPWYAVLAGGAMGGMFLEQPDVALFFSMFFGPYAIYAIWREYGWDKAVLTRILAPLLIVLALIMFRPLWTGYQTSVTGVASIEEDPQEKWNFVTQWSWPPEESIDFIAPGFMGWRSNEPEGPYWGRMGRSAGWEQTKQGFQNFKLENQYIGGVAVVLALWALWIGIMCKEGERKTRRELICWSIIAGVSLLLSFGKYFPLYRVFYLFPVVSSIRNPNKFLHIFQVATAILAAYGLDALVGRKREVWVSKLDPSRVRLARTGLYVITGLVVVWLLGTMTSTSSIIARLTREGWPSVAAESIVSNQLKGLAIAAVSFIACAVIFTMATRLKKAVDEEKLRKASWVLVFLLVFDVLYLSQHYVRTLDPGLIKENDVVRALKSVMTDHRVALVAQSGFYNNWLTYLFPYHDIDTVNVTQLPRMPTDYKRFLGALRPKPIRFWRLCAAPFILGPAEMWAQIQQDPNMKDLFGVIYAYNVAPAGPLSVNVVAGTQEQPGSHVILQMIPQAPRYALFKGWRVAGDDEALALMQSETYPLFERVLVAPESTEGLPPSEDTSQTGSIAVKSYRPGRVHLQTTSEQPVILRLADRYTPGWRVMVDGEEQDMLRVDYLFQGVFLPAGLHNVIVQYAPTRLPFGIQIIGMLACALSLLVLAAKRFRSGSGEEIPVEPS